METINRGKRIGNCSDGGDSSIFLSIHITIGSLFQIPIVYEARSFPRGRAILLVTKAKPKEVSPDGDIYRLGIEPIALSIEIISTDIISMIVLITMMTTVNSSEPNR